MPSCAASSSRTSSKFSPASRIMTQSKTSGLRPWVTSTPPSSWIAAMTLATASPPSFCTNLRGPGGRPRHWPRRPAGLGLQRRADRPMMPARRRRRPRRRQKAELHCWWRLVDRARVCRCPGPLLQPGRPAPPRISTKLPLLRWMHLTENRLAVSHFNAHAGRWRVAAPVLPILAGGSFSGVSSGERPGNGASRVKSLLGPAHALPHRARHHIGHLRPLWDALHRRPAPTTGYLSRTVEARQPRRPGRVAHPLWLSVSPALRVPRGRGRGQGRAARTTPALRGFPRVFALGAGLPPHVSKRRRRRDRPSGSSSGDLQ